MSQQMPVVVEKKPSFLRRNRSKVLMVVGGLVLIFVVMQLIPLDQTNPPVKAEPNWDSAQTRELAAVACFDCHSNETDWSPWYANLAPARFLVWRDVEEGRSTLNFSEWSDSMSAEMAGEIAEVINEGEMPPAQYTLMHGEAKLSDEEKQQLIDGFAATFANGQPATAVPSESEDDEEDED